MFSGNVIQLSRLISQWKKNIKPEPDQSFWKFLAAKD